MQDALVFNLHDVTVFLTITEGLLLSIFWKIADKEKQFINRILQLYFCSIALNAVANLMVWNSAIKAHVDPYATPIAMMAALASLSKGPLLYLYFTAHIHNWKHFHRRHLLHFALPFIVMISYIVIDIDSIRLTKSIDAHEHDWGVFYAWSVMRLTPFLYALACFTYFFHSRKLVRAYYDSTNQAHIHWLQLLIIGYLIHWGWAFVVHVLGQRIPPPMAHQLGNIEDYTAFVLVNIVVIYSFKYSSELLNIQKNLANTSDNLGIDSDNAERSDISEQGNDENLERHKIIIQKIENAISVDKIFLRKNMTVERFSDAIGYSCRDISHIINTHYACNFLEFINHHRIHEAMRLLSDKSHQDTPIGDIISLSGFNSKSAFHRFFKRVAGMTPTEFKQNSESYEKCPST